MFAWNISTLHNGEVTQLISTQNISARLQVRCKASECATSLAHACVASQRTFNLSRRSLFLRCEVKEWVTSEEIHSGMH